MSILGDARVDDDEQDDEVPNEQEQKLQVQVQVQDQWIAPLQCEEQEGTRDEQEPKE